MINDSQKISDISDDGSTAIYYVSHKTSANNKTQLCNDFFTYFLCHYKIILCSI